MWQAEGASSGNANKSHGVPPSGRRALVRRAARPDVGSAPLRPDYRPHGPARISPVEVGGVKARHTPVEKQGVGAAELVLEQMRERPEGHRLVRDREDRGVLVA